MRTQCPNCEARFAVKEQNVGKRAKCPKCSKPFIIEPFVEAAVEAPAVPETPVEEKPKPAKAPAPAPVEADVVEADVEEEPEPEEAPAVAVPPRPVEEKPKPAKAPAVAPVEADVEEKPKPEEAPAVAVPPRPVEEKPKPEKAPAVAVPPRPVEEKPEPEEAPAVPEEPVDQEPESKELSKTVYVYGWSAVRIIAGIFCALGLTLAMRKAAGSAVVLTLAAGNVFLIGSVVIELMLHYKMWSAIQDDYASLSAAKAVGLLFIPVFNIYWVLYAVVGFAEDYNVFIRRHRVQTKKLSIILFLLYAAVLLFSAVAVTMPVICVLPFTGLIPRAFVVYPIASWFLFFFAIAAGISHFIVYIIFAIKTCHAINALPD